MKVMTWFCLFLLSVAIGLFIAVMHFVAGVFFFMVIVAPLGKKMSRAMDEKEQRQRDREVEAEIAEVRKNQEAMLKMTKEELRAEEMRREKEYLMKLSRITDNCFSKKR